jgi:hypothetical protein
MSEVIALLTLSLDGYATFELDSARGDSHRHCAYIGSGARLFDKANKKNAVTRTLANEAMLQPLLRLAFQ